MQGRFINAIVTFCVVILGATTTAFAQIPGTAVKANIPFDFVVRGKVLPAGSYEVKRVTDNPDTLSIQNLEQTKVIELFNTDPMMKRDGFRQSELVFHRYGDVYFLDEIAAKGDQTARRLIPSKQERHLERELASNHNGSKFETVTLAAN